MHNRASGELFHPLPPPLRTVARYACLADRTCARSAIALYLTYHALGESVEGAVRPIGVGKHPAEVEAVSPGQLLQVVEDVAERWEGESMAY